MSACVARRQRLAKEFHWLLVLLETQFRCQHCVSIILKLDAEMLFFFFKKRRSIYTAQKPQRPLTYFANRLKRHLSINFISFRICLRKKKGFFPIISKSGKEKEHKKGRLQLQ
jgi:hypothetical protein